jgi:hypothetical protein
MRVALTLASCSAISSSQFTVHIPTPPDHGPVECNDSPVLPIFDVAMALAIAAAEAYVLTRPDPNQGHDQPSAPGIGGILLPFEVAVVTVAISVPAGFAASGVAGFARMSTCRDLEASAEATCRDMSRVSCRELEVREVAEQQRLHVDNDPAHGTTFWCASSGDGSCWLTEPRCRAAGGGCLEINEVWCARLRAADGAERFSCGSTQDACGAVLGLPASRAATQLAGCAAYVAKPGP